MNPNDWDIIAGEAADRYLSHLEGVGFRLGPDSKGLLLIATPSGIWGEPVCSTLGTIIDGTEPAHGAGWNGPLGLIRGIDYPDST